MPLLQTHNLCKKYKVGDSSILALNNINLTIEQGDFIAIAGQSGSGKSTLMHILGCLDVPTTGSYYLDNQDVSGLNSDQLAHIRNTKIGFVFQQFNLLQDLTALDNVALPLFYANWDEDSAHSRAQELLALVGLAERAHHYPHQLSGGQQQRVAIARALANKPAIILADEPTGNLDSKTGIDMMNILKILNQEHGITIIIVTHDAAIAAQAQRVIRLLDGHNV